MKFYLRIRRALAYCLMIALAVFSPQAAMADETGQASSIADYQDMTIMNDELYILADDGIWCRNLLTLHEALLVSYTEMSEKWDITSADNLFTYQDQLAVIDRVGMCLYCWNNGRMVPLAALQNASGIRMQYTRTVAATENMLFILNNGMLWACEPESGEVERVNVSGISEIVSAQQDTLLAVRSHSEKNHCSAHVRLNKTSLFRGFLGHHCTISSPADG